MSEELTYKLYSPTGCIPEQTMFDYIDNKLGPKEQHEVEKHMLDCELCADAMEGLRMVKDRSRIAAINQRISGMMAAPAEKKVVKMNYYRISASIAAGIVLLIGSVFMFRFLITNNEQDVAEMKSVQNRNEDSLSNNKTVTTEYETAPVTEQAPPPPPAASVPVTKENTATTKDNTITLESNAIEEEKAQELDVKASRKPNAPDNTTTQGDGFTTSVTAGSTTTTVTANDRLMEYNYTVTDETKKDKSQQAPAKDQDDSKAKTAGNTNGKLFEKAEESQLVMKSLSKEAVEQKQSQKKEKESKADFEQNVSSFGETGSNIAYAPAEVTSSDMNRFIADSITVKQNAPGYFYVNTVDQQAQFPGGETEMVKYIQKNFNYGSEDYKAQNISNTKIYIEFVVTQKGEITNVKIKKGINPALDKEAIRVIKSMPKWTPAKKDGKAVDMIVTYPIRLELK